MAKYQFYTHFVEALKKENRDQKWESFTPIDGASAFFQNENWLTFCSHDYLGLGTNPEVKKSAMRQLLEHGITAASECHHLYTTCQRRLEEKLAALLHREASLLFASRYDANVTALSALGHDKAVFFIDEKSHPSLLQGVHESLASVLIYKDLAHLETLLHGQDDKDKIFVTESVFSLTGDIAPLMGLIELAKRTGALLYVDDAHGFGIMGPEGYGLCSHLKEVAIISGSFSKACGAYGGFIACPQVIRDYLMQFHPRSTHYLFPPPLIGALEAALDLIGQLEGERKQLQQRSHWLRHALTDLGFTLSKPNTPLISIAFDDADEAKSLSAFLEEAHILAGPIRIETQEIAVYRLNLLLNICHRPDHLSTLIDTIKEWQRSYSYVGNVAKC